MDAERQEAERILLAIQNVPNHTRWDQECEENLQEDIIMAALKKAREEVEADKAEARREGFREGVERLRDALISKWENDEIRCAIVILIAEKLLAEQKEKGGGTDVPLKD
jgi:hypothetical protein